MSSAFPFERGGPRAAPRSRVSRQQAPTTRARKKKVARKRRYMNLQSTVCCTGLHQASFMHQTASRPRGAAAGRAAPADPAAGAAGGPVRAAGRIGSDGGYSSPRRSSERLRKKVTGRPGSTCGRSNSSAPVVARRSARSWRITRHCQLFDFRLRIAPSLGRSGHLGREQHAKRTREAAAPHLSRQDRRNLPAGDRSSHGEPRRRLPGAARIKCLAGFHLGTQIGRFFAPTREFLDAETTPRPSPPATTACQNAETVRDICSPRANAQWYRATAYAPYRRTGIPRGGPVAWPCAHVRAPENS